MSGPLAARALDDVQRVLDDVEVAQAQEVHLQQAELLDRLHRELGDEPVVAARRCRSPLPPLPESASCSGTMSVSGHPGDDDRGGVDRRVAHDPLQAPRDVDDLLGRGVSVVGAAQRLARLQAALEGRRAPLLGVGDELGQAVADAVVVAEHARGVAGGGAREHLAEGDDLRDRLAAVLGHDVLHDALAPAHREVDVDIGHRHALGVQEALEEQVVAQRIDVGDAQRVGDDRAGGAAASRADGDAVVLRPLDEVPDDEEVGVVAHAVDDRELHLGALDRLGRHRIAVAGAQALHHALAQVGALVLALGQVARDELAPELDGHVAALGDLDAWRRSPRATRRRPRPSPRWSAGRTRWCRRSSSAPRAWTSSARTAAPCGGGSPRGAGSGRRRCPRAGARPRARCARCPRWPCPDRRCRSSGPRSRRCRRRRRSSGRRRGRAPRRRDRRPGAGRSARPGSP